MEERAISRPSRPANCCGALGCAMTVIAEEKYHRLSHNEDSNHFEMIKLTNQKSVPRPPRVLGSKEIPHDQCLLTSGIPEVGHPHDCFGSFLSSTREFCPPRPSRPVTLPNLLRSSHGEGDETLYGYHLTLQRPDF